MLFLSVCFIGSKNNEEEVKREFDEMNRGGMDLFRGITYTHSTDREIGVGE